MSSFAEKVAAAKESRPTVDVSILLVAELIAEKERLEAIIEADDGDARLGLKSAADEAREALVELEASAGEGMIVLRFTQLPGHRWAEITGKHLPRVGNLIDENHGYNYDAVTDEAAAFVDTVGKAYGVRLEDDAEIPLSEDEWAELRDAVSGHEVSSIRNAIWGLNVFLPKRKLEALGKAFGAAARSVKN